jgi:hypothetical protein
VAVLDLLAGDNAGAGRNLEAYRSATGKTLTLAVSAGSSPEQWPAAAIPGPFRSFARMAAISAEAAPEDVLPALARNVVTNGYQASHSNDALEQTEYLKLVHRYLSQAHELEKLAGESKTIKVETCDSPVTADLIRILGFRMRGGCGAEVVLETVNAARAFLTTDSGFPVHELETRLRTNRPFSLDYRPTMVPVYFGPEYWMGASKEKGPDFIETFLSDPSICRLYLGYSKLDRETAEAMRKGLAFPRLKAFAHILDFFGAMFEIRDGKAVTPGGQRSAAAWTELVGAPPDKGVEFFDKLMSKDDGWLASLYDALARIHGPIQEYLTDPARMKRFYAAVRGRLTSPGPARPVFRSNTDMMLLTTRLRVAPEEAAHSGEPRGLEESLRQSSAGQVRRKLTKLATTWKDPDDVIEALFALVPQGGGKRAAEDLHGAERSGPQPCHTSGAGHRRPPGACLSRLRRTVRGLERIAQPQRCITGQVPGNRRAAEQDPDPLFRSDVVGSFQSLVSLWQILVRQGSIAESKADATFAGILGSFAAVRNDRDLFDAGRGGVKLLMAATPAPAAGGAAQPQQRMIELLAGVGVSEDEEVRAQVIQDLSRILEAQRIISLDTLFQIADHLEAIAKGEKLNTQLINRLAARITDLQLPRAALSANEKNAMGFGYWTEKHIDAQRKINLRSAIEKAAGDGKKSGTSAGSCRRCCAIRCYLSATPITRRPARRSCTPIRCLSAVMISSGCRDRRTPGVPPSCMEPAGRRMAAAGWSVRFRRYRTRSLKRSRIS